MPDQADSPSQAKALPGFTIEHPDHGHAFPIGKFSAFGSAPAGTKIYGELVSDRGEVFPGTTIRHPTRTGGRWNVMFLDVPYSQFSLRIRHGSETGEIIAVRERLSLDRDHKLIIVNISWPQNGSKQCPSRVPMYGYIGSPDTAINALNLDGVNPSFLYVDFLSGYVAAEFSVGAGNRELVFEGNATAATPVTVDCDPAVC